MDDAVDLRVVLEAVRVFTMGYASVAVTVQCAHVLEPLSDRHLLSDSRRDQVIGFDVMSFKIRLGLADQTIGLLLFALF